MKIYFFLILFLMSSFSFAKENTLTEFKTDYCTLFFEGTITRPNVWKSCCYEHDLRYWFGGSKKEQHKSDIILKQCVRKKAGSFWANLMYAGVRTGHYSPIKNKYQWGWGWTLKRNFSPLTSSEKKHVRVELEKLNLELELLQRFLKTYDL